MCGMCLCMWLREKNGNHKGSLRTNCICQFLNVLWFVMVAVPQGCAHEAENPSDIFELSV